MPGFYISNIKSSVVLNNIIKNTSFEEEIVNKKFTIKRNTLNKFDKDKLFCETDEYIVITEGALLNSKELIKKYNSTDLLNCIVNMFRKNSDHFFNDFIGPYSGAIYEKECECWTVWTNQTGDVPVFLYQDKGKFIVASQVNYILDCLRINGIKLTLNEQGIYSILTYGFMYDGITYATEIKRITSGSYLCIRDNDVSENKYWELSNDKYDLYSASEDFILEEVNKRFVKATELEFKKDIEYGYRHIADLSGGFDSRMVNFVAKKLGYANIINISYSQYGSDDMKISHQVASYLKHELIFKELDNIEFIFDIDRLVSMDWGLSSCSFITGGERFLRVLNFDEFGIEHTGLIGDVVIGTFIKHMYEFLEKKPFGYYSGLLIDRLDKNHINKFQNSEMQRMYNRAFLGACCSILLRRNYTETYSPFLNPELLEFCMSIPLEMRYNHKLYDKWVMKYYPEAANFVWESTGSKITDSDFRKFITKVRKRGIDKIIRILGLKQRVRNIGMNPFDYWYQSDPRFERYYRCYFEENINNKILPKNIKNDISRLFIEGTAREKAQALTVLSALKLYF